MNSSKNYYSRQVILEEVGPAGQQKLSEAKVLVIGAGGLGAPLLNYLTAAGIGEINIYDFDKVEESNLHRQTLFSPADIGKYKASVAKEKLSKQNPHIKINSYNQLFDSSTNINNIDIIVDCSDSFKSKFSAHDMAYNAKIVFCVASIHKFEGQLQLFNFKDPGQVCMRCLWQKRPGNDCVQNCAQAGVIGATAGIIGSIQAMEVIKYILGINHLKNNENLIINLLDFKSFKLKNKKNESCPLCSNPPKELIDDNPDSYLEIPFSDLGQGIYTVVSLVPPPKNVKIDMISSIETILNDLQNIDKKQKIAIICQRGFTSLVAIKRLREHGYLNSFSVEDGFSQTIL